MKLKRISMTGTSATIAQEREQADLCNDTSGTDGSGKGEARPRLGSPTSLPGESTSGVVPVKYSVTETID